nr:MAG: phosphoprotein [Rovyktys virus]
MSSSSLLLSSKEKLEKTKTMKSNVKALKKTISANMLEDVFNEISEGALIAKTQSHQALLDEKELEIIPAYDLFRQLFQLKISEYRNCCENSQITDWVSSFDIRKYVFQMSHEEIMEHLQGNYPDFQFEDLIVFYHKYIAESWEKFCTKGCYGSLDQNRLKRRQFQITMLLIWFRIMYINPMFRLEKIKLSLCGKAHEMMSFIGDSFDEGIHLEGEIRKVIQRLPKMENCLDMFNVSKVLDSRGQDLDSHFKTGFVPKQLIFLWIKISPLCRYSEWLESSLRVNCLNKLVTQCFNNKLNIGFEETFSHSVILDCSKTVDSIYERIGVLEEKLAKRMMVKAKESLAKLKFKCSYTPEENLINHLKENQEHEGVVEASSQKGQRKNPSSQRDNISSLLPLDRQDPTKARTNISPQTPTVQDMVNQAENNKKPNRKSIKKNQTDDELIIFPRTHDTIRMELMFRSHPELFKGVLQMIDSSIGESMQPLTHINQIPDRALLLGSNAAEATRLLNLCSAINPETLAVLLTDVNMCKSKVEFSLLLNKYLEIFQHCNNQTTYLQALKIDELSTLLQTSISEFMDSSEKMFLHHKTAESSLTAVVAEGRKFTKEFAQQTANLKKMFNPSVEPHKPASLKIIERYEKKEQKKVLQTPLETVISPFYPKVKTTKLAGKINGQPITLVFEKVKPALEGRLIEIISQSEQEPLTDRVKTILQQLIGKKANEIGSNIMTLEKICFTTLTRSPSMDISISDTVDLAQDDDFSSA